jgi:hypothetical protein
MYEYPVFPTSFVEENVSSPTYVFDMLAAN